MHAHIDMPAHDLLGDGLAQRALVRVDVAGQMKLEIERAVIHRLQAQNYLALWHRAAHTDKSGHAANGLAHGNVF